MINHTAVCQSFACGGTYYSVPFFPSPKAKPLPRLAPLAACPGGWLNLPGFSLLPFHAGSMFVCRAGRDQSMPLLALAGGRQNFSPALFWRKNAHCWQWGTDAGVTGTGVDDPVLMILSCSHGWWAGWQEASRTKTRRFLPSKVFSMCSLLQLWRPYILTADTGVIRYSIVHHITCGTSSCSLFWLTANVGQWSGHGMWSKSVEPKWNGSGGGGGGGCSSTRNHTCTSICESPGLKKACG